MSEHRLIVVDAQGNAWGFDQRSFGFWTKLTGGAPLLEVKRMQGDMPRTLAEFLEPATVIYEPDSAERLNYVPDGL